MYTVDNALKLDFLLVPGGWGSLPPADTTAEVEFIRKIYRGDGYQPLQYLFGVCTGSGLLAQGMYVSSTMLLYDSAIPSTRPFRKPV